MNSPIDSPTLKDLRAFMAVAEHRSFRRAAELLGVTRSSLSHTLRGLEEKLSTRLLHRTTRSVSLTQAGEQFLARLDPLLGDLSQLLEDVAGAQGRTLGTLRINGSEPAIRLLVATLVPKFLLRYPDVQLDLTVQGELVDIVKKGFDAGIRLGDAVPKDMVAVRLGPDIRFLAVASPAYLQAHPAPDTPDDLVHHQCIRQRFPSGKRYRWEFRKQGQEFVLDVPGALTLDHHQLMVEAAAAGVGIAYVMEEYARPYIDKGNLVTVLESWCPHISGLTLYFPNNRHVPGSLRAFIDMAKESTQ
ncbi:LysR family transcriptional regulator [Alcaligenes endophyticus]|uniref:LysR family transcriptional regulator n=1 Tax=Alcaligenes endophyticus TaxID=1929088 RepID=A0ABT8EL60_9BURK|nr:LysR family transcriptional regulator [Alcaligenes endophyticus]MCX5590691.1 LysR family transcriptional regulator [Alcaligenes endophyticus]MDN4121945.1 LysR family transcriptional regulator [Alcaligenes endophyticus]